MVNAKEKGSRVEGELINILREHTGYPFERTPKSGSLPSNMKLKGDLWIPQASNVYTIEVKSQKEDPLGSRKLLVNKSSSLFNWWEQTLRESEQNDNYPLLFYKYNYGGWYAVWSLDHQPLLNEHNRIKTPASNYIMIKGYNLIIQAIEDFLDFNKDLEYVT